MYRVITKYRNGGASRPVIERGPWHPTQDLARFWADLLRESGYVTEIESQHSGHTLDAAGGNDNAALAEALASMA